jgi:hypothetical protein
MSPFPQWPQARVVLGIEWFCPGDSRATVWEQRETSKLTLAR